MGALGGSMVTLYHAVYRHHDTLNCYTDTDGPGPGTSAGTGRLKSVVATQSAIVYGHVRARRHGGATSILLRKLVSECRDLHLVWR